MSSSINKTMTISETSPATASTVAGSVVPTLDRYAYLMIDAELVGATGGTLDIYLQRRVTKSDGTDVWYDWLHFPQLSAGASAVKYTVTPTATAGIVTVGKDTSPALAANTCIGGHPGEALRALYVAGSGTSAGAAVVINITGVGDVTRC